MQDKIAIAPGNLGITLEVYCNHVLLGKSLGIWERKDRPRSAFCLFLRNSPTSTQIMNLFFFVVFFIVLHVKRQIGSILKKKREAECEFLEPPFQALLIYVRIHVGNTPLKTRKKRLRLYRFVYNRNMFSHSKKKAGMNTYESRLCAY